MVVSIVNLTRAALVSARPDLRRELLIDLSEREGIRVYPAEADERLTGPPPDRPVLQLAIAEIRRQLGRDTRVAFARDGIEAFWVSFRIEDDEYWVMLPRERVERRLALQWLGWAVLTAALALLGAFLVVFRVRRPLAALTRAAADIGRGRIPRAARRVGPGRDPDRLARLQPDGAGSRAPRGRPRTDPRRRLARSPHAARPPAPRARDGRRRPAAQERHDRRHRRHRPDHRPVPRLRARRARRAARRGRPRGRSRARSPGATARPAMRSPRRSPRCPSSRCGRSPSAASSPICSTTRSATARRTFSCGWFRRPAASSSKFSTAVRASRRRRSSGSSNPSPASRPKARAAARADPASGSRSSTASHGCTAARFDLLPREGGGLIARVTFPRGQLQRDSTR